MPNFSLSKPDKPLGLRDITIEKDINTHAEGSCIITMGKTIVYTTATIEDKVPDWLRGQNKSWLSAEYSMLPRATKNRNKRERDKTSSRSLEISRLIGRSLRSSLNLTTLGEKLILIDCDVLQADGSTRCASITGGMISLALSLRNLISPALYSEYIFNNLVAAVSVGIVSGNFCLDLDYSEDSKALVDMNIVMNSSNNFVEIQGTAEGGSFSEHDFQELRSLASRGISYLIYLQNLALISDDKVIRG